MGGERAPLLEVTGLAKAFGPNPVLRDVSLLVAPASVHALLGENGAGKSTLARVLLGMERADAGAILLGGARYAPASAEEARRAGVVLVPQERTLCAHLTVVDNVVLGIEPLARARLGIRDRSRARAVARAAIALVTADPGRVPLDARAGELGVADQQLVEIARALAQGGLREDGRLAARLLVLDEPTSSLGRSDAARLFERVGALRDAGLAVLLVTHFLSDVRAHADRYTVLRDGRVAGEGDPREIEPAQIVREMLGRALDDTRACADTRASAVPEAARPDGGEVVLEAEGVSGVKRPKRASLTLRRGEILGIAGLVGSGRTELLRILAGLDPRRGGTVALRAPRGIGLLSEDRGGEGLMLGRSLAENVWLSPRAPRFARPRSVLSEGARWIEELAIRACGPEQRAGELSGGNQQKVQIARLLREDFDVLLVDEPTRGIDVASKAQVLALLRDLARAGKAIVLVSSQLDELVTTCDRIAVLRRGTLDPPRPASSWTEASLLLEASS
ncbi:Sugar ABC transporter ATP-binding protein [Sorangium cellulosum So ce56]|uniref:Sugar ABC transporter ATP-binding protein n=1 Tax=Sorangium cellulosum (strain So ce56) TaxID=448385 RepID=A9GMT4_SORC5|nr:sugar ABC transporter ATP-binding protein [Sorangium cellulosum]CAN93482.1 Sugar ABC transporter ATP-binding protein [Sorangium cellulosum So ce56]